MDMFIIVNHDYAVDVAVEKAEQQSISQWNQASDQIKKLLIVIPNAD